MLMEFISHNEFNHREIQLLSYDACALLVHGHGLSGVLSYYAPRKISGEHIVAALSVRPSVRLSVRTSHSCPAHNFVI